MAIDKEALRKEFETAVLSPNTLEPPCGMANSLIRDEFGRYRDEYMEGAFQGFILGRDSKSASLCVDLLESPWGSIQSSIYTEATNDLVIKVARIHGVVLPCAEVEAKVGIDEARRLGYYREKG